MNLKQAFRSAAYAFVYFLTLCVIASLYIYELWTYASFIGAFSLLNFTISAVLVFIFSYTGELKFRFGNIVYIFILYFSYLPMLATWTMESYDVEYLVAISLAMSIFRLSLVIEFLPKRLLNIYLPNYIRPVCILILVTVFVFLAFSRGLSSMIFGFSDVYANRQDVAAALSVGGMGYLAIWSGKVIIPYYFGSSIKSGNKGGIVLWTGLTLLLFSFTTLKSNLFYPVIVLLLWAVHEKTAWQSYIARALIIFNSVAFSLWYFIDNHSLLAIFVRRAIFFPARLNVAYYEYFSVNGFVYLSNNVMASFIDYPLWGKHVDVIGAYIGFEDMAANTGLFGTGYMHLGVVGVPIFAFILVLFVQWIDSLIVIRGLGFVAIAACINPVREIIVSSDLLTGILSHGVLFSLLLVMMMRRDSSPVKVEKKTNAR